MQIKEHANEVRKIQAIQQQGLVNKQIKHSPCIFQGVSSYLCFDPDLNVMYHNDVPLFNKVRVEEVHILM